VTTPSQIGLVFTPAKAWRIFVIVLAVLGAIYVTLDLAVNGPLATWTFELAVVQPVEAGYGFDAEWQNVGGYTHLIIVSVVPGGRFDRGRAKAGYAFAPARCGWFALGGGWYALLSNASDPVRISLQTVPGDITTEQAFQIP
jgi:hypothetical protein